MPNLGLSLNIQSGVVLKKVQAFDADYQAVLNRATALSYGLPSASVQTKQNQLVINLKAAGVWAKLDVFYMYANDSAGTAFSMLNWKTPTLYESSLVGSLTFGKYGFTGAASSLINTNFNPFSNGVNFTSSNASAGIWKFLNNNTSSKWMFGNSGAFNNTPGDSGSNGAVRIMTGNTTVGGTPTSVNNQATGLLISNKLNNTGTSSVIGSNNMMFYSGGLAQVRDTTNQNLVTGNYTVFSYAPAATSVAYLGGISSFFAGASLSAEAAAFDTAMTTYINSL